MRGAVAAVARVVRLRPVPDGSGPAARASYFVTLGGVSGVAAWAWGEEVLA